MGKELPNKEAFLDLPSFSIVYETDNLSSVEIENIYRSLASLAAQDISIEKANEFLVIDGGEPPTEALADLCSKYPWITVKQRPGIRYDAMKMEGASLASGEIIIFCDSDCIYVEGWLSNILTSFANNSTINVIAGETSTPVRNPYELAIAMHYFFPRFSSKSNVYKSGGYFLNNVAFRRNFLLHNPMPRNLPLYRGSCAMHAYALTKLKNYQIWRNPQARTIHEPPTIAFSFWRYLWIGHDQLKKEYIKFYLAEHKDRADYPALFTKLSPSLYKQRNVQILKSTILNSKPFKRKQIRTVLKEDPRRLLILPISLPIMTWFSLLYGIGVVATFFQPDLLLKFHNRFKDGFIRSFLLGYSSINPSS